MQKIGSARNYRSGDAEDTVEKTLMSAGQIHQTAEHNYSTQNSQECIRACWTKILLGKTDTPRPLNNIVCFYQKSQAQ